MILYVKKEFLEELRLELDRHTKMLDSLTKKTTNLIIAAGVVSAILFGFQTLPLEFEQDKENLIWPHAIWISIVLLIVSIIVNILLNVNKIQNTPFLRENFLDDSRKFDLEIMKKWTSASADEYYEKLSEEYIKCLIQSERVIKFRSFLLNSSIVAFWTGLVNVSVFFIMSI